MINLMTSCRKNDTILPLGFTFLGLISCTQLFGQTDPLPLAPPSNLNSVLESSFQDGQVQDPLLPPPIRNEDREELLETEFALDNQREQEDLEILTRGPLHEAFAAAHQGDPAPNPIVLKAPPEQIEEVPPEFKPEGNNVQWIPGYWAWDDADGQFIWISGIWRDIPKERGWVPGYWSEITEGYRWVNGYWAEEERHETHFLPPPPLSLDQGPSHVAPGDNYFYVPGCWVYRLNHYVWQPGYWNVAVTGRIWVPSRYVWTPAGCVFCPGYWDYDFGSRGVCFAPVRFRTPLYLHQGYHYTPTCSLNTGVNFLVHLFVRPGCGSYYFGDWYDHHHHHGQIYQPWYRLASHARFYDPLLSYYRCSNIRFENRVLAHWVGDRHHYFAQHAAFRPAHTFHHSGFHNNGTHVSIGTNYLGVVFNVGGKKYSNHGHHVAGHANINRKFRQANLAHAQANAVKTRQREQERRIKEQLKRNRDAERVADASRRERERAIEKARRTKIEEARRALAAREIARRKKEKLAKNNAREQAARLATEKKRTPNKVANQKVVKKPSLVDRRPSRDIAQDLVANRRVAEQQKNQRLTQKSLTQQQAVHRRAIAKQQADTRRIQLQSAAKQRADAKSADRAKDRLAVKNRQQDLIRQQQQAAAQRAFDRQKKSQAEAAARIAAEQRRRSDDRRTKASVSPVPNKAASNASQRFRQDQQRRQKEANAKRVADAQRRQTQQRPSDSATRAAQQKLTQQQRQRDLAARQKASAAKRAADGARRQQQQRQAAAAAQQAKQRRAADQQRRQQQAAQKAAQARQRADAQRRQRDAARRARQSQQKAKKQKGKR